MGKKNKPQTVVLNMSCQVLEAWEEGEHVCVCLQWADGLVSIEKLELDRLPKVGSWMKL